MSLKRAINSASINARHSSRVSFEARIINIQANEPANGTGPGGKRFTGIRGPRNGNLAAIRFFFSFLFLFLFFPGQNYDPDCGSSVGVRAVPRNCVGPRPRLLSPR